jgi:hypothetical protein
MTNFSGNLIAEGGYVASTEEADKIAAVLWHRRRAQHGCSRQAATGTR